MLTPGQRADIDTIAEGWGVPPATAAYAMVATFLSKARQRALDLGPAGLKLSASCRILAAQGVHATREAPPKATDARPDDPHNDTHPSESETT